MLFMFANKMKKVTTMYKDNLAIATSLKHYKEFIKNIQKHIDKKKKEDEKQQTKMLDKPKIVIFNDNINTTNNGASSEQLNAQRFQPNSQIRINQEFVGAKPNINMNQVDRMQIQSNNFN